MPHFLTKLHCIYCTDFWPSIILEQMEMGVDLILSPMKSFKSLIGYGFEFPCGTNCQKQVYKSGLSNR